MRTSGAIQISGAGVLRKSGDNANIMANKNTRNNKSIMDGAIKIRGTGANISQRGELNIKVMCLVYYSSEIKPAAGVVFK